MSLGEIHETLAAKEKITIQQTDSEDSKDTIDNQGDSEDSNDTIDNPEAIETVFPHVHVSHVQVILDYPDQVYEAISRDVMDIIGQLTTMI
jgi:hypothetical protein